MEFSEEDKELIDQTQAAVVAAKADLNLLLNPPPPVTPPETKGKKAPPPPPEPEPPDPDKVAELEAVVAEKTKMYKEVMERVEVCLPLLANLLRFYMIVIRSLWMQDT